MANINALFPTKYIKAADLQGQDLTLQIAGLSIEKIDDNSQEPVIKFANHNQGLVLNKTNALTIAELYGEDYDRWSGRMITLYSTQCTFGGKMVDCIRVRQAVPQAAQPLHQMPQQYPQNGQAHQFGSPNQWGQQPPPPPPMMPYQGQQVPPYGQSQSPYPQGMQGYYQ